MNYFLILLISLISVTINAQSLSNREVKKLSGLDFEVTAHEQHDVQLTNHFRKILLAEKERKSNKRSGLILTTLSALSIGYGIVISSGPPDTFWHENPQRGFLGGMLIGTGIIEGGIGIPLLFISKKRKRQRDKLIREYQNDLK